MSDSCEVNPIMKLDNKIDKLCSGIERMQEKQSEMADDIVKIKEAVYNPEEGLYARIRALESWKNTSTKLIWTLVTGLIGVIGAIVLKNIA